VILSNNLENLFRPLRDQLQSKSEPLSLRGYSWADLILPPYERLNIPFQLIVYGSNDDLLAYLSKKIQRKKELGTTSGASEKATRQKKGNEDEVSTNDYARARGLLFHECVVNTLTQARKSIYRAKQVKSLDIVRSLNKNRGALLKKRSKIFAKYGLSKTDRKRLTVLSERVVSFETLLVCAHVNYWISRSPAMSLDSLLSSAVPMLLEHNISFPEMGFSGDMTPDFVYPQFSAIGELKTGEPSLSHRIAVTGYALAYEKQHNLDVDFGVLLYLDVQDFKAPLYKIDAFIISDVYRRLFVEHRNDKFVFAKKEIEKLQKNGITSAGSNKANS